eukprot:365205-Chlamydomonas_euryale.AAC.5
MDSRQSCIYHPQHANKKPVESVSKSRVSEYCTETISTWNGCAPHCTVHPYHPVPISPHIPHTRLQTSGAQNDTACCILGGLGRMIQHAASLVDLGDPNGSDGVNPLIPHLNVRQVQKGKEGTKAGKGQDETAENLNEKGRKGEKKQGKGPEEERNIAEKDRQGEGGKSRKQESRRCTARA